MIDTDKLDRLFLGIESKIGLIFSGTSGIGKSYNAKRLSEKYQIPTFACIKDMARYDGKKTNRMIIFFDEAQKLKLQEQESLLLIMDMDKVSFTNYKGKVYEHVALTFLFATTDLNKIISPLRTRSLVVTFPNCSEQDIYTIMRPLYPEISDDDLTSISKRCKCNPRQADHLCRMFINMGYDVFTSLDIDENGLNQAEREYLSQLDYRGDASVTQMANALSTSVETITEIIEPYFLQKNAVEVTSRGRRLTDYGRSLAGNIAGISGNVFQPNNSLF